MRASVQSRPTYLEFNSLRPPLITREHAGHKPTWSLDRADAGLLADLGGVDDDHPPFTDDRERGNDHDSRVVFVGLSVPEGTVDG